MDFDLFKYQALGNDYLVIEPGTKWFKAEPDLIKELCDRHFGVGSDGILFGPNWNGETPVLRIFNPDGSEAEKSGNGLRIFARHLHKRGHVNSKNFEIETHAGKVQAWILDETGRQIKINMGKASFKPEDIPINSQGEFIDEKIDTAFGEYNFTCLSVGNPHAVFFPKVWNENLIHQIGPEIENNKIFPNRTNVQMVKVLNNKNIEIRIWERGAGFTLASGSSSCAAAAVSYKLGLVGRNIQVDMPGGQILVEIAESGHILMTGAVNDVFFGVRNM